MQSPTGTNQQNWSFVVVSDADKRAAIADFYRRAGEMMTGSGYPPPLPEGDPRIPATERVMDSAAYLAECLQEVPVFVIPCVQGRMEQVPMIVAQASTYGSILPAAWSFMLAARARGLGSAWTTIHLFFHDSILGLIEPDVVAKALASDGAGVHTSWTAGGQPIRPWNDVGLNGPSRIGGSNEFIKV